VLGAAAADAGASVTIRSVKCAGLPRKGDGVLRPSIAPRWGKGKLSSGETVLIFHSMRRVEKNPQCLPTAGSPPQLSRSSSTTAPSVILPRGPCLYLNAPMPRPRIQAARQSREADGWCLLTPALGTAAARRHSAAFRLSCAALDIGTGSIATGNKEPRVGMRGPHYTLRKYVSLFPAPARSRAVRVMVQTEEGNCSKNYNGY
jgi:hypothetical protein